MSYAAISKSLKINYQTVFTVVRRFVKNNYKIENKKSQCGRKRQAIPEDIENYLLDNKTLYEHAYSSIQARCEEIEKSFGYRITKNKLRKFYEQNDIVYSQPKIVSVRAYTNAQ